MDRARIQKTRNAILIIFVAENLNSPPRASQFQYQQSIFRSLPNFVTTAFIAIIGSTMETLEALLERAEQSHEHMCAGLVLGVRMALLGCRINPVNFSVRQHQPV
jgi:hypothetical protein